MKTDTHYTISSKPTEYRGQLFRSRVEATWAAFFDQCGWSWQYEPFDMNGWSPDFLLQFKTPTLVEVKPTIQQCEEVRERLEKSFVDPRFELLILSSGLLPAQKFSELWIGESVIGWLSQFRDDSYLSTMQRHFFAGAPIYICGHCKKPTITHSLDTYSCRLNGCYDGDHYLSDDGDFVQLWNQASRLTSFHR